MWMDSTSFYDVKAPLLTKGLEQPQPKGLLPLLKDLAGALAWIPDAIPGFLLECYAGVARGGELAISLLHLSSFVFRSVFSNLFDLTGVAGTTCEVVFYVGNGLVSASFSSLWRCCGGVCAELFSVERSGGKLR